ncbi:hypothetical protein BN871_BM_00500 [Paenibacillus sp. P22]|nr:hypothetical protein BN871_BM_00500 [Paenibacillus sp. P22]
MICSTWRSRRRRSRRSGSRCCINAAEPRTSCMKRTSSSRSMLFVSACRFIMRKDRASMNGDIGMRRSSACWRGSRSRKKRARRSALFFMGSRLPRIACNRRARRCVKGNIEEKDNGQTASVRIVIPQHFLGKTKKAPRRELIDPAAAELVLEDAASRVVVVFPPAGVDGTGRDARLAVGVNDFAAADVHADMRYRRVEEDEIPGLEIALGDVGADLGLRFGRTRKRDACFLVGVLHQAGAVEVLGRAGRSAEFVRSAHLRFGGIDDGRGFRGSRCGCRLCFRCRQESASGNGDAKCNRSGCDFFCKLVEVVFHDV